VAPKHKIAILSKTNLTILIEFQYFINNAALNETAYVALAADTRTWETVCNIFAPI
jgi:hypothetical protein